ncbi:hypothetical protein [Streptomyces longwoodensis]|uniref:hypothetical protein n=1 Tax=Streptomyces longwoodensis TaxID=68231 RepID=UPI0037F988DF
MRVTEYFNVGRSQREVDFVDVDVDSDTLAFIDPRALSAMPTPWAHNCVSRIQGYFQVILDALMDGDTSRAKYLLSTLREPNETHLGYSKGRPRGSGVGEKIAEEIYEALSASSAVRTGMLQDLEEAALFVPGIGPDRVSDLAVNIIRGQLIEFTHEACDYYQIPMVDSVPSGPVWDSRKKRWESYYTRLPLVNDTPLILVPKSIVRRKLQFDPQDYYTHHILPFLEQEELAASGSLVHLLRSGPRVYRRDLKQKYGVGKETNTRITVQNPEILENYRRQKDQNPQPAMDHDWLPGAEAEEEFDWDALLDKVLNTPVGKAHADTYHRNVEALLSALFYPHLTSPRREFKIHGGMKRIDIAYVNESRHGFFYWLSQHYPAPFVFVECKNYGKELKNPEFDQLVGRFSPSRGKFGIITHRGFGDKDKVLRSCRNSAHDDHGWMVVLDDNDLRALVEERIELGASEFTLIREQFEALVN